MCIEVTMWVRSMFISAIVVKKIVVTIFDTTALPKMGPKSVLPSRGVQQYSTPFQIEVHIVLGDNHYVWGEG